MMKKLLTLMTLLLCVVVEVKAETETIFSADAIATSDQSFSNGTTEITSAQATITGGKMYAISGQTDAKKLIVKSGEFSMTNNNTIFKIVLNKALAVGDVITIRSHGGDKNGVNKGLWVTTAEERPTSAPACSAAAAEPTGMTDNFLNYTVTSSDGYAGATTLYVHRAAGATQNFDKFKITREVAASLPVINTQPVGGKYAVDATATVLSVAATASKGSLSYQWYSNTSESTEGATAISGATSATYTPSTAAEGTTYYYCVVTDDNGSTTSNIVSVKVSNSSEDVVGYTEAINGTALDARVLTGATNITITGPSFGSAITDQGSKSVYINNTAYTNNKSWRKSTTTYDNQYVGYTLTVASGYKMNISHVSARIAVADDTYNWYVEILNGAGTQVWKSGEKTTTKASSGVVDADVTDKVAIQGLTGDVTVNLYVKQGGSTKYFSINYLQLTVETEVDTRPTYAMSVSQNIEGVGTVTPTDGSEITEGESVAFTATPNTDYRFVKWVIDGVDQTTNPYVIENVDAAHTAVAHFAKRFTVSYSLGEYTGTLTGKALCNVRRDNDIDEVYSDDTDNYTIPAYAHKYLHREGYIFDKWQDGEGNEYNSGDIIAMTKDLTLTPIWKATTQVLSSSGSENIVTWSFAKANLVFVDWQSNDKYGYYVQKATVNGEEIAVPMSIINGKVANYTRTDAIAQTNKDTKLTIPAVNGMIVEIIDAYVNLSTTTIAGSTDYMGTGTKSISYTYAGSDATIDIVIGESGQYLSTIKVTYPRTYTYVDVTSVGYRTFTSDKALDFTNGVEGLTAYRAVVSDKTISFAPITGAVPAGEGMLLKANEGTYYIPVAAGTPAAIENAFEGVTSETVVDGAGIFVLMNGASGVGFYKTTAATFTVGANTAYLPADIAAGRTFIGFDDFDDETTNINSLTPNPSPKGEGSIYTLSGQRVEKPVKGLYVKNGKKWMVK